MSKEVIAIRVVVHVVVILLHRLRRIVLLLVVMMRHALAVKKPAHRHKAVMVNQTTQGNTNDIIQKLPRAVPPPGSTDIIQQP
jgi:hypothetical protein